ncbi:MAG: hypothetical protein JW833_02775, partial [Prolixibacteraceae bacterium]|nr:hypothetical protein [Prolixibacteraceae bacterium]
KFYFEPRFSASYQTENNFIFKVATGRYLQFLNKSASEQSYGYNRDFWVLADDVTHPIIRSNHYIAGISYKQDRLFFDVEIYYKTINGLQEYLFFQYPGQRTAEPSRDTPGLSRFISGKGQAYGIDLLAKYENNGFTSWFAYSLSKTTSNYDEINNGENIPALYDQTHELKWTNIYSYNNWNFSTLTLFTTGRPYIKSSEKDDQFNTVREYSRLPDYFRIDLSMNYNINLKKVNIKPGISVLNALNTENYLDVYVRNFNIENRQVTETTLIKAQKLTFNFYLNFRF